MYHWCLIWRFIRGITTITTLSMLIDCAGSRGWPRAKTPIVNYRPNKTRWIIGEIAVQTFRLPNSSNSNWWNGKSKQIWSSDSSFKVIRTALVGCVQLCKLNPQKYEKLCVCIFSPPIYCCSSVRVCVCVCVCAFAAVNVWKCDCNWWWQIRRFTGAKSLSQMHITWTKFRKFLSWKP